MYSIPKSAAGVAAILVLVVVVGITISVVDARLPKTRVVTPPECVGISDKDYNKNLRHLLDFFVDETKNTYRKPGADYVYDHSYPNRDLAGSVNGVATCNTELAGLDCWSCLRKAKGLVNSRCDRPIASTVTLQDCSITFKNVA